MSTKLPRTIIQLLLRYLKRKLYLIILTRILLSLCNNLSISSSFLITSLSASDNLGIIKYSSFNEERIIKVDLFSFTLIRFSDFNLESFGTTIFRIFGNENDFSTRTFTLNLFFNMVKFEDYSKNSIFCDRSIKISSNSIYSN